MPAAAPVPVQTTMPGQPAARPGSATTANGGFTMLLAAVQQLDQAMGTGAAPAAGQGTAPPPGSQIQLPADLPSGPKAPPAGKGKQAHSAGTTQTDIPAAGPAISAAARACVPATAPAAATSLRETRPGE